MISLDVNTDVSVIVFDVVNTTKFVVDMIWLTDVVSVTTLTSVDVVV